MTSVFELQLARDFLFGSCPPVYTLPGTWTTDSMIEVGLREPDDFLKVRETLTRIGVASRKETVSYTHLTLPTKA